LKKITIAFIPLRGGSKSIPNKNIKKLVGKPLLCYSVDAALEAEEVDKVVVSTDSEEIKQVIHQHYPHQEKLVLFVRDPSTATDTASTESAMIDFAERASFDFDDIILIQATSPLIESGHLDDGYKKYRDNKLGGLVSVVCQKRFIWDEDTPQNYDPQNRPRRQEFNGYLVENGAFYITSKQNLLKSKCRISKPYGTYEMPESTFFEIDEPEDWEIVESLVKRKQEKQKKSKLPKKIDAVVLDFDGVFTDNKVIVFQNGEEAVICDRGDGMGIGLLKKVKIPIWVISKEKNPVLKARCDKLDIDCYHGIDDKWTILKKQIDKKGFNVENVIYVGNDINDIECMENVGCGIAVSDSHDNVLKIADLVLKHNGGKGALRELSDLILNYYFPGDKS